MRTKRIIITLLLLLITNVTYAQTEVYLGNIRKEYDGGQVFYNGFGKDKSKEIYYSDEQLYYKLMSAAKMQYGESNIKLKGFATSINEKDIVQSIENGVVVSRTAQRTYVASAIVYAIQTEPVVTSSANSVAPLNQSLTKALQDIREGSRLALDQIKIVNGDKEDFKDQVIEILLDEGYKVVAKDYLEKLYEEQKAQQSGIYNDRTTVQENNFSAVGYYINVKQTETAIKVQVINVSTGEYEANVTVNL